VNETGVGRSENMSRIRGKDTGPERTLRRALWAAGLRYRLNTDLPGRPDIAFPSKRLAVFVDGCFWHGCPEHYSSPSENAVFWAKKLRDNALRDTKVDGQLRSSGWAVCHVWQHELRDIDKVIRSVKDSLREPQTSRIPAFSDCWGDTPWWSCSCGSRDVQILRVTGGGSLRRGASRRPGEAELSCRHCHSRYRRVPSAPED